MPLRKDRRCACIGCCERRDEEEREKAAEKKGIATWLALPEDARRALLGILRTERAMDTTVDCAAADALEELPRLLAEKEEWERRYYELAAAVKSGTHSADPVEGGTECAL